MLIYFYIIYDTMTITNSFVRLIHNVMVKRYFWLQKHKNKNNPKNKNKVKKKQTLRTASQSFAVKNTTQIDVKI